MKKVLYQHQFDDLENSNKQAYWLLPQLLAFIGTKFPLAKVEGKFSFKESLLAIKTALDSGTIQLDNGEVVSAALVKQWFQWLNQNPRGNLLQGIKQTTILGSRWAANVPLILSAFKEYRNIGYNSWRWDEPERQYFLDKDLLELSEHFYQPIDWTEEQLLEFREIGRTVKSGQNNGKVRNVISCTTITGIPDPVFNKLSRLHKLMLTQCWVYSPQIRSKFAITNQLDLDSEAPQLVNTEIFETQTQPLCDWL